MSEMREVMELHDEVEQLEATILLLWKCLERSLDMNTTKTMRVAVRNRDLDVTCAVLGVDAAFVAKEKKPKVKP